MDNHNSGWNPPRAQYPWKQGDELFADELNAAIANAITLGGQLSVATITDTPPVAQYIGQLWFDSSNPQLYVWYDDGTSAQWVIATAYAGGLTTDAPSDGQTYGRQNGAWTNIAGSGGYLPISGATPMAGPLTLSGNATLALHAVPLQQLNSAVAAATAGGPFLPLSGGTVTGATMFNPSVAAVGSANTVTLAGAATTAPGTLTMTGSDANISLRLVTKGTGTLQTGRMDVASNTNGQGVFDGSTALFIHGNNSYTTTCNPTLSVAQSAAGIVTSGLAAFNQIAVSLDNVNATAVQGASAFRVGHAFGGSNTLGNRTAISAYLQQTATTGNPRVDGRFYTALGARSLSSVNDNGTSTTAGGNMFGSNIITGLETGATFWNSLVGMEIDTYAATGTSVLYKIGMQIVNFVGDAVAGSLGVDNALQFAGANSGSSPGWNRLISVGGYNGWYPLAATGTVIGTTAPSLALPSGPAYAAAYGIDFSAITFSTAFLRSAGFSVDGSGNCAALKVTAPTVQETRIAMAANDIDCNAGAFFTKSITGNTTLTVSNVPAANTVPSFILELTNGGAFTVTWWAGVSWGFGTPPVLTAAGTDVLAFYTLNGGTTWRGMLLGKAMA